MLLSDTLLNFNVWEELGLTEKWRKARHISAASSLLDDWAGWVDKKGRLDSWR